LAKKRANTEDRLNAYEAAYRALAAQLGEVGFIWNGSIHRQTLTCGRSWCACHTDRAKRHGPYAYWGTKVKGKSVSRLLQPPEADLLEGWIQNRRKLEQIRSQMLALSGKVARLLLGKVRAKAVPSKA
jgi:hypothetical protein